MKDILRVLMWKHLMVRLRRFIQTPVEIVSPIIFLIILYVFLKPDDKPPSSYYNKSDNVMLTETLPLEDTRAPARVLYTPSTTLTYLLMDIVGKKIGRERLDYLSTADHRSRAYYPLPKEMDLDEYMKNMSEDEAIIIFHNMTGDTWPNRLNYTIRMKYDYFVHQYQSLDSTHGSHSRFGTMYEPFMRLQWAIDTAYIQLLTDNHINQTVYLQEFPYAKTNENPLIELICNLLMFICWISLLLVFVFLMSRLLEERTSGIQVMMKMLGVTSKLLYTSHFLNVLPAGLIYSIVGTILLKLYNVIIPHTNPVLIFLMLFLHFVSVVSMAFACSFLAKSTQYTVTISIFAYIILWIPTRLAFTKIKYRGLMLLSGLLPQTPMVWFWDQVYKVEIYDHGITFSNMFTSHSANSGSVFLCYVCFIIQTMVFFLFTWYLSLVRPGNYEQALPWNFLFRRQYWNKKKVIPDIMDDEEVEEPMSEYFEKPPNDMDVGIKILNVSKVFQKHRALTDVSLEVYKGEITVLVGHNGAGKTTLMSIITGMVSATEGKVYVNGMDTKTQIDEVRRHLGLCPQHNLFFSDLTVLEHVMFFTLLKGGTFKEAKVSSLHLLEKLGIHQKANSKSSELSGGMKRRLQLACALTGGADVLILDEPTSGLDVETRRELWDLLLSLRGARTVLLTTHFMEEADALGDRVAALHQGRLRCHATTMYLKKAVGTGYRLSFTTVGVPKEAPITHVIQSHVRDATVREKSLNTISYNLPSKNSSTFPPLFTDLENRRSELGIDTIGVGVSTLEEVFLKLCSDITTSFAEDTVDASSVEPTYNQLTGLRLYLNHLKVLLLRQVTYIMSKKFSFLILQVILPIVMVFVFTEMVNDDKTVQRRNDGAAMNLDMYKDMPEQRVMYNIDANDINLRTISDRYPKVDFELVPDVADAALRSGKRSKIEYNKYIAGVEINSTDFKVLFTTTVRHAAPVAMNLLSNIVATRYIPWADGQTISTVNHPVENMDRLNKNSLNLAEPKSTGMIIMWAMLIVFVILATNINMVSLPCKERLSGARHIHIMSGCSPLMYWSATLLFHSVICVLALIVPTVIAAACLEQNYTLNQPSALGMIALTLFVGCLAFLAFIYLISFYFGERCSSSILIAVIFTFCVITPSVLFATELVDAKHGLAYYLTTVCGYVIPVHPLVVGLLRVGITAKLNAYCELNRHMCPLLLVPEVDFKRTECCASKSEPHCYLCLGERAAGRELLILLVQFVVYFTLVVQTQRGTFEVLHNRLLNMIYRPDPHQYNDEMVRAERAYVDKAIALPTKQIPDAMLVHDLHKMYHNVIRKSCNAVKGISFSVKKGECLGLLGVNGAGKSCTFKMLTGMECATRGRLFANGYHHGEQTSKYLRTLGYCPQFFGLDEFQTGRQNLTMLLTLRGLRQNDVRSEVDSWIGLVGLGKYSGRAVSAYSGGCARRLGAAAALCGGAPLTLLDEPTAGVDVAARRAVWRAVKRAMRSQRALVVTSHSMDEMEALCGRIAIMYGGEVCALGSPAALRAAYAAGHALVFKLHAHRVAPIAADVTDNTKTELNKLKGQLLRTFNCTLKDEHKTMLHYHINETMRYSELFQEMEKLKSSFPIIEDYSVTETTLEEVFLSFAKDSQEVATP